MNVTVLEFFSAGFAHVRHLHIEVQDHADQSMVRIQRCRLLT